MRRRLSRWTCAPGRSTDGRQKDVYIGEGVGGTGHKDVCAEVPRVKVGKDHGLQGHEPSPSTRATPPRSEWKSPAVPATRRLRRVLLDNNVNQWFGTIQLGDGVT